MQSHSNFTQGILPNGIINSSAQLEFKKISLINSRISLLLKSSINILIVPVVDSLLVDDLADDARDDTLSLVLLVPREGDVGLDLKYT